MTTKQRLIRFIETMFPDNLEMDNFSLTFSNNDMVILTMSRESKETEGDVDGT